MAKIVEDIIFIKFSKIVKDNEMDSSPAVSAENIKAIEQVAQELVGDAVIIEVAYDKSSW